MKKSKLSYTGRKNSRILKSLYYYYKSVKLVHLIEAGLSSVDAVPYI